MYQKYKWYQLQGISIGEDSRGECSYSYQSEKSAVNFHPKEKKKSPFFSPP